MFCSKLSAALAVSQLTMQATAAVIQRRAIPSGVPSFATAYAPLVYLYSADPYRPSDLGAQLTNTQPEINYTTVSGAPSPLTLDNLSSLNSVPGSTNGSNVYLTSKDYIDLPGTIPSWLYGVTPDSTGKTQNATSCAIIVNQHSESLVDVFYMYFYAYNWGGTFLGINLDDHVGDWEHNMIRFENGEPQAVWFSQHANGEAFTYAALSKSGQRPYVFSANGSHANYAVNGTHDHTLQIVNLPDGDDFLEDYTDQGPVWDPTLNAYYYSYDAATGRFAAYDDATPVDWLYFLGAWGDQQYNSSDPRQFSLFNIEHKYDSGPTGPIDKQLNRTDVCPSNGYPCIVYDEARAR